MRTAPPDLLRRAMAGLAAGALTEVSSPYAQAQVRHVFALLDTVAAEWDEAADRLARENDALQAFCGRAAELITSIDAPQPARALAGPLLGAAALPPAADIKLHSLGARNDALWAAATPALELLATADAEAAWAAALTAEARPLLHAYVDARRYRPGG